MTDNALHLKDEDKQALAVSIADIVVRRIPRIEPYFVSRADIDVMLGNGYNSSLTDEIIKDPNFPKPYKLSPKGKRRWKRTEVIEFFEQRFKEAAC